jgi:cell division septation protein DedD
MACAVLLAWLAGCATVPPPAPVPRPEPPAPAAPASSPESAPTGTQVGTTASGGTITTHQAQAVAPAAVDSLPSRDALAVLSTIPEPLGASESSDSAGVPVPTPTQPLGDPSGTRATAALPETLAAPNPAPTSAPPGAAPAAGVSTGAGAAADSCWRVQVAAPPEQDRAQRLVDAARSQLLLPFVIEGEGGLFKVRVRDCLSADAANDLRRRALASGFAGAFRFHAKPR